MQARGHIVEHNCTVNSQSEDWDSKSLHNRVMAWFIELRISSKSKHDPKLSFTYQKNTPTKCQIRCCEVLVLTQSFTSHMSHIVSLAHGYHLLKDLCHWGNLMNRQDWPWHRLHLRTHPEPLSSKRRPKSSQDHWKWAQHQATPLVSALARQKNGGLATTSYCIHMKF